MGRVGREQIRGRWGEERRRQEERGRIDTLSNFTQRGWFPICGLGGGGSKLCGWADRRWQRKERRAEMGQ